MLKNLILMLMIVSMISSVWCCGPARSFPVVQQQIQQQAVQNNQTPPPTFDLAIKDVLGDFSQAFDNKNIEGDLASDVVNLVDELEGFLNLPAFSGDSFESRDQRNEKQEKVVQELVNGVNGDQGLTQSIVSFLQASNQEIAGLANDPSVGQAPAGILDSYFEQVSILHREFFKDVINEVKSSLGNNLDENTIVNNSNEAAGIIETTDQNAQIVSGVNDQVPSASDILAAIKFSEQEFVQDFTNLKNATINQIKSLNEVTNSTDRAFADVIPTAAEFQSALDSGFESPTLADDFASRLNVRLDIVNPGQFGSQDRGNKSIIDMINRLTQIFPSESNLAQDLRFFLSFFPAATEQAVIDGLTPGENVFTDGSITLNDAQNIQFDNNNPLVNGTSNTFTSKSFVLGSEGQLIGINNNADVIGDRFVEQASTADKTVIGIDNFGASDPRGFNTRAFGGSPGNITSVEITVGERTYVLQDTLFTSPIILDMNGDGELEASNGTYLPHVYKAGRIAEFDIDGDGFVDLTEWVGENDGILIQYNPSKPVDGTQLFGDAQGYLDGYEKLRLLDTNDDKVISGDELVTLSVWQDRNLNAKVDDGEIKSLQQLGITELGVEDDDYVSNFTMNGKKLKTWDWYPCTFKVKKRK